MKPTKYTATSIYHFAFFYSHPEIFLSDNNLLKSVKILRYHEAPDFFQNCGILLQNWSFRQNERDGKILILIMEGTKK